MKEGTRPFGRNKSCRIAWELEIESRDYLDTAWFLFSTAVSTIECAALRGRGGIDR